MADGGGYDSWSTPALLRAARDRYRWATKSALVGAGFDDMPRDGAYVLGGMAGAGAPLSALITQMGMSKQAAGALIDTMVVRGYLDRTVDVEDRRRLTVTLTERGQEAATVVRSAVDRVDTQLTDRLGPGPLADLRATLVALIAGAGAAEGD
jgi:DNA-binding MarR family transcriptional regulator